MIHTFALLDEDQLREARGWLAQGAWSDGRASAGPQAAQAKRNEQLAADSDAAAALQALVTVALERSPRFLATALPRKLLPPQFNRYGGAANAYGPHVDNAVRFTAGGARVRTDLSCTVFLSGLGEYEGGELVIHEFGEQRAIKLAAGHAVLYPGTSVHEVRPVTRGTRLAAFFWVESMVRGAEQRRLLLELDDALVQLRATHGESAATIALTGTYHNLLRMWADA